MTVLLFKTVGTLQVSSYRITVICMVRAYLIIYVHIFERLSEHCIFRVNLSWVLNIFTVMGLIFVSMLSFECGETIFFHNFADSERKMLFLLHSLSSGCVRFCTVWIIEQVILNLDYHWSPMNIIFRFCKSRVSSGQVFQNVPHYYKGPPV